MNSYEEWVRLLEGYTTSLDGDALHHLHIHLSGIEYSSKGERNHLPLRESDLDLKSLFKALHQYDCQGRILCESPVMENDALYMRQVWEG
jgi:deoxyribonuclease-4